MKKTFDEIRQEYLDQEALSDETLQELIRHMGNILDSHEAMTLATDMVLKDLSVSGTLFHKLVPYLAKQLDHENSFVRGSALTCVVGRLKLIKYAKKAFDMAKKDPYDAVRNSAVEALSSVINLVDSHLSQEIANYLYDIVTHDEYEDLLRKYAYNSIEKAMEIPPELRQKIPPNRDIDQFINEELLEKFKTKYNIKPNTRTN